MTSGKISVIIPTKDRPRELARCLESVLGQTLPPDEIIIVDASNRESASSHVESYSNKRTKVRLIRSEAGLTHQRNVGIEASCGDIVVFFDDDAVLEKDCIEEIVNVFNDDLERKIGGVSGKVISAQKQDGRSLRSMLASAIGAVHRAIAIVFLLRNKGDGTFRTSGFPNYPYTSREVSEVEFLSGCCHAYRRQIFTEFKFDEKLKGYSYNEDVDFSYRVSRKYVNIYTPRAQLVHKPSPAGRLDTIGREKMLIENSYYLFKKNLPQTPKYKLAFYWALIGLGLVAILQGVTGRNMGILRGFIAGLVSMKRMDKRGNQCKA